MDDHLARQMITLLERISAQMRDVTQLLDSIDTYTARTANNTEQ